MSKEQTISDKMSGLSGWVVRWPSSRLQVEVEYISEACRPFPQPLLGLLIQALGV
jgi:hypothetical protein